MKWYALFVKNGEEEYVRYQIQIELGNVDCKCFIPKRKVPEKKSGVIVHVIKMMFPGYVFLQTKMDFSKYNKIKKIHYIISFLNYRNKKDIQFQNEDVFFKWIPDEEMEVLFELIDPKTDTIEYSKFWLCNNKLTILSGPLVGMEDRIKKIDKRQQRAKLAIYIMGQEKLIDIGFEAMDSTTNTLLNPIQCPWLEVRQRVENMIKELLQLSTLTSLSNKFISNGINSIYFIKLIYNVESEFGIKVSDDFLSMEKLQTIDDLVHYIQTESQ
ncbi:hypothetical protein A3844_28590 [Paenibacillus helianthi]|uniref:Carrier domain-containing protein n=1 Tax=Paenibacillus helianthi TaxID=1349432 RepID=A0ABX3EHW2_9BACL|nr:antiterminator LoaP [Paenibacillus helianthi]OKP79488.1 hypothetical protein A3844_28590 [Paenibacillus helianthi]